MTAPSDPAAPRAPRTLAQRIALSVLALAAVAAFLALGTWQLQRRTWKLDLIARVNARVHAAPSQAPGQTAWPKITVHGDAYRRVIVHGRFDHGKETLVQAVTELGPGFWVMTPLVSDRGFTVLINRGFVPPERRDPRTRAPGQIAGPVTIIGLLRLSEPRGGFLRRNDPAGDRWRSRDVAAIAGTRNLPLGLTAPYFIDADSAPNPGGLPVGGLTVIAFPNSHLIYALTWYGLALLLAGGFAYAAQEDRRGQRQATPGRERGR